MIEVGRKMYCKKRDLIGMVVLIKGDEAVIRYEKLGEGAPHEVEKIADLSEISPVKS